MTRPSDRIDARIERVREHLAATEELPVERSASRWIGEAQAVVADIAGEDLPATVRRERLGHAARLLRNVDGTGHPAADRRVETALELTERILDRLEESD